MEQHDQINILLVDDHPAKLISYEVMLGRLGENLIKASSAREAFEHLLKTEIALVLVDVCMPELDGFELAAMIREHPRFQKTAIIFISAIHLADDDRLRGYRMGAVDYMPVPVVPEILRAKVKVFAELYRKTRQLEQLNSELERRVAKRTAELEASNAQLIDSESRRNVALAAGKMASWDWDLERGAHHWDAENCRIFGVDPETFKLSTAAVRALVHPDDWQNFEALWAEAQRGRQSFELETRFVRPDGEVGWCVVAAAASFGRDGQLIRISGVTSDITERKQAEERHALLAREVDHRAKNALAIVQAIVRLTRAKSIQAYAKAIEGRVTALSHAHTLLSESRWQGAELRRLVFEELVPYKDVNSDQLSISGPDITLEPEKAQSLALVLHELATNSAKYGALSSQAGKLSMIWNRVNGGITLAWMETDGPVTKPPKQKGFGINVITATVEGQLRGTVEFDWRDTGLRCNFFIPSKSVGEGSGMPHSGMAHRVVQHGHGRKTVMLVEDEALIAMTMRDTLAEMGIDTVGPFGCVKEALAAARVHALSAAILDVNLGNELVYEVADLLISKNIPFVFVTGYSRESIDKRFSNIPVLQKPVEQEDLRRAIYGAAPREDAAMLSA